MIHKRTAGLRMRSNRRMFSRRTVVGVVIGVIIGFNLASWLAVSVPSRTNIEIEVIASNRVDGRNRAQDVPELRARVRRKGKVDFIESGPDCDHEVVAYKNSENENAYRQDKHGRTKHNKHPQNVQVEEEVNKDKKKDDSYLPNEFDIREERIRRQKELEVIYESDVETEDDGEVFQENKRLEDFQFLGNAQKYVDYDSELTKSQSNQNLNFDQKESNAKGYEQNQHPPLALNPKLQHRVKVATDRKHFLYVGVLTAQKYLATRGRAIADTWSNDVPGKVEFYVGEGVRNVDDGEAPLPLVKLHKVKDDVYPPQKKSFLLLKYMHDKYLDSGYQWFMRADDDVYIKTDKLESFLRNLNSSQPLFLGQTGLGNAEERGRLNLPHGDNYCMGGPGMIFSREVLRRVGPHIRECVKQLYSWHEDVELSRCVRRFAGVNCAWSYQMQELFYEHYALRKGYIDPNVNPHNSKLHTAFSLHPNKNPQYQVKLHNFMRAQKMHKLMTRIKEMSRDLLVTDRFLGKTSTMEDFMLGIPPSLNRFPPRERQAVYTWDFMTDRLWFSSAHNQARRSISVDKQIAVRDMVMRVMESMNVNSKSRGRTIEFKQVAYGYRRVNPLYGAEYVMDLLLLYKRFKGKKVSVPVRRHAYLQQTFARTLLHEQSPFDIQAIRTLIDGAKPGIISSFFNFASKKLKNFLPAVRADSSVKLIPQLVSGASVEAHHAELSMSKSASQQLLRYDSGKFTSFSSDVTKTDVPTVHIIIPLKGRFDTFQSFMINLERACLSKGDPVSLLIILFVSDNDLIGKEESVKTTELLNVYAKQYPQYDLRVIPINGSFSRGLGLEIGASHFSNNSLLFFCDIDVVFESTFMQKCRANSVLGSKVYYPILFSQFYPDFEIVSSSREQFPDLGMNIPELQEMSSVKKLQFGKNPFEIGDSLGYWRSYGYGLLCTYKKDFAETGGFDISIQGWGLEDVDLVDKFSTGRHGSAKPHKGSDSSTEGLTKNKVNVIRTPDPSLVHVFHLSYCDVNLMENQLRMCRASRASGITSTINLAKLWKAVMTSNDTAIDSARGISLAKQDKQPFMKRKILTEKHSFKIREAGKRKENNVKSDTNSRLKQYFNKAPVDAR